MNQSIIPRHIPNWIGGKEVNASNENVFDKPDPATGVVLCQVSQSNGEDVKKAVDAAKKAYSTWTDVPPVQRGMQLHEIVLEMRRRKDDVASIVTAETGKSKKEALGETEGAIALGLFYASEGQRLYGKTTTSGVPNKLAMTVRQSIGVAGLIIAANTPIANVAWKVFPALICGNTAVLKAAEDTPATAWIFGKIASDAGLPPGVLNIIQGFGEEAGQPLVQNEDVGIISFTGSTSVGRQIASVAGKRLARISLELGGKNALVVCDDADLENAAKWILLSAFSNAGQRCVAASRIIIFEAVYDRFKKLLIEETEKLKLGTTDNDDLGPVINEKQLTNMIEIVQQAQKAGASVLTGGSRSKSPACKNGFFMEPTIIENVSPADEISTIELFGPITCLYRAKDFNDALKQVNDSPYGLSASIHTKNFNRATEFTQKVKTGVAVVNAGTHGSEPHMPFGGTKMSGNGSREPGTEALNIYSELKDIYLNVEVKDI